MAVKSVSHVPNSCPILTFNSYSGLCSVPHSTLHLSQTFHVFLLSKICWWEGLHNLHLLVIYWSFTGDLTSSLRSLCWTSQETVACGERGRHSRKVLLFSVPYTTLSSITSRSSAWKTEQRINQDVDTYNNGEAVCKPGSFLESCEDVTVNVWLGEKFQPLQRKQTPLGLSL